MTPAQQHAYGECPNTKFINDDLLPRLNEAERDIDKLQQSEARRAGGEAMLKWLIGITGVGSFSSVITLITLVATGKL